MANSKQQQQSSKAPTEVQIKSRLGYPIVCSYADGKDHEGKKRFSRAMIVPRDATFEGAGLPSGVTPMPGEIWAKIKGKPSVARRLDEGDLRVMNQGA